MSAKPDSVGLPTRIELKANTRAWLNMWIAAGRPSDPRWWANCHHVIRAKLKEQVDAHLRSSSPYRPFRKE